MTQEERAGELIQTLHHCFRFIRYRTYGGKGSQSRILRELRWHGDMTQRRLQEHMNIQQSSISELMKKMEQQGLICRTTCPQDRRQVQISLTPQGLEQLEQTEADAMAQNAAYLQVLTPEEQELLLSLLHKLDTGWAQCYPGKESRKGEQP